MGELISTVYGLEYPLGGPVIFSIASIVYFRYFAWMT